MFQNPLSRHSGTTKGFWNYILTTTTPKASNREKYDVDEGYKGIKLKQ